MERKSAAALAQELETLLAEDRASVDDRVRSTFDRILEAVRGNIVLFGAGSLGRSSLRCLLRDGIRPLAFCDNNPALWNTQVEGIPVLSPIDATATYGSTAAFFVTIWSLFQRYAETHDVLAAAGCRHVYPASPLRWKFSSELLPYFLQDKPQKVYEDAAEIRSAFDLWADDRSRGEYLAQVRCRALGDHYSLGAPDPEPSYFLDSLYRLIADEVFVDCGAYDGDTIREVLCRRGKDFLRIIALEPDPANFLATRRYIAGLPSDVSLRITAFPYAVSARRGQVRFSANGSLSSRVSESGEVVIEAFPLDELIPDLAPTFVKMDIEGAEMDALEGARRLISRCQPLLSICVYHRQNDLWRIPLLIHSIYPGYRFYLRSHENDGWQTVCYAVPQHRLVSPADS